MKTPMRIAAALFLCAIAFSVYGGAQKKPQAEAVETPPATSEETLPTRSEGKDALDLETAVAFDTKVEANAEMTCAVILNVPAHVDCDMSLCNQHDCGEPFRFDPIGCTCYCGYQF